MGARASFILCLFEGGTENGLGFPSHVPGVRGAVHRGLYLDHDPHLQGNLRYDSPVLQRAMTISVNKLPDQVALDTARSLAKWVPPSVLGGCINR